MIEEAERNPVVDQVPPGCAINRLERLNHEVTRVGDFKFMRKAGKADRLIHSVAD